MSSQAPRLPAWLSAILVIVILGGGIGVAVAFVKTRPTPQKEQEEVALTVVDVAVVEEGTQSVELELNGQVQPSRQIVVMPEVGGRVVWQSAEVMPGGIVRKGDPLVRIDPRDYSLAVQQQQAQLSSQQLTLKVEEGRRKVAEREWELFKKEREAAGLPLPNGDDQALALRKPYVDSAEVGVSSAKSGLDRAQLALSKTVLTAPFNAFVRSESVEKGQLVSPSMQLITLVGTDTFWVQVSVPIDKLGYVRLPRGDEPGSKVKVSQQTGGGRVEREGRVIRLLGDLDPIGRLARVLVEVQDPFRLKEGSSKVGDLSPKEETSSKKSELPLLLGSYVRVQIEGVELDDVVRIPRLALMENNKVYRLDADDKLVIETVEIAWGTRDYVMVRGPLKKGDRLITTNLAAPVEGMKLRVADAAPGPSASGGKVAAP